MLTTKPVRSLATLPPRRWPARGLRPSHGWARRCGRATTIIDGRHYRLRAEEVKAQYELRAGEPTGRLSDGDRGGAEAADRQARRARPPRVGSHASTLGSLALPPSPGRVSARAARRDVSLIPPRISSSSASVSLPLPRTWPSDFSIRSRAASRAPPSMSRTARSAAGDRQLTVTALVPPLPAGSPCRDPMPGPTTVSRAPPARLRSAGPSPVRHAQASLQQADLDPVWRPARVPASCR
jgi:hypothetical protein